MYQTLIRKLYLNVVLFSVLFLSGCATVQYHDWHEGEPKSGAILTSKETILIESINGTETDSTFIGQIHNYELSPGKYTLVVSYADLFDKTADDFEKIKSNPIKLEFIVGGGKSYQLEHREIKGLDDAKSFANKPLIKVLDIETGHELATKVEYTTPRSILSRIKFNSEEQQVFASDYLGDSSASVPENSQKVEVSEADSSTLKMLKFSWQQATPEDRQAFLNWLNSQ